MAAFSIANWNTLECLMAYRPKTIKTAVTAVKAATAALKTAFGAVGDDNAIGDALRAAAMDADDALDTLEQAAAEKFARLVAILWQSTDTTPDTTYLSFDQWFSAKKSSLTNPLMTNEMVETFRRAFGTAAISASNAAAPSGTSLGTATITGATAVTLSAVTAPIDTALYAGGLLELYVTTQVESADTSPTTGTLTGTDINGSAWTGTFSISDASVATTAAEVTPTIAKSYPVAITAMTVANGGSGAVTIRIKEPRTIAAS